MVHYSLLNSFTNTTHSTHLLVTQSMNHKKIEENNCPLCNSNSEEFFQTKKRLYHQCSTCRSIFMDLSQRHSAKDELTRYKEHNNDVTDKRYQNFVSPITTAIFNNFNTIDKGLDFGAGPGPVISKILTDKNFDIKLYDPYFHNNQKLLDNKYDYIVCCEVIEHFYNPFKEFSLLKQLLATNGKLYCMTDIYSKDVNFKSWYYKDDLTHVFIFQKDTILWIKEKFKFTEAIIDGRLITFSV